MSDKTMQKSIISFIKVTAILLVAFVVLTGAFRLVGNAMTESEVSECLKWYNESDDYDTKYFIAKWQDEQCRHHGILINAEVR